MNACTLYMFIYMYNTAVKMANVGVHTLHVYYASVVIYCVDIHLLQYVCLLLLVEYEINY